jgi:hypothetical protein
MSHSVMSKTDSLSNKPKENATTSINRDRLLNFEAMSDTASSQLPGNRINASSECGLLCAVRTNEDKFMLAVRGGVAS